MSRSLGPRTGPPAADAAASPEGRELERLRQLLFSAERERLGDIEHRLSDPDVRAEELSRVLPAAIATASRRTSQLGIALSSVLEEAFAASVRKNRRSLADALSPAMGPAIRRAIAEALRATVDSFNQVLQQSVSPRALRWRFEAWRTGRPFAEVVLTHSLLFRVEQVFLVHRATGLLLQHAAADRQHVPDADLISGMLTAIQDFVRDSFSVDQAHAVDSMRVGDLAVWVEQGDDAYLAALVRGTPPAGLRRVLRDALDAVQIEFAEALNGFSGDAAPFEAARPHLEGCLQMQVASSRQRRRWLLPGIAAGLVVAVLGVWLVLALTASRRWQAYLARLSQEPGILVVQQDGGIWRSTITGLTDPQAVDPDRLLGEYGIDRSRVTSRWRRYLAQDPAMILARAKAVLQPPSSVSLRFENGTLTASGPASHRWATAATARASAIPGVVRFDAQQVADGNMAAVAALRARLEAIVIRFDVGASEPRPQSRAACDEAATVLRDLVGAAQRAGFDYRVDVTGRTDGTGTESHNVRLSRARAAWVVAALERAGVRDTEFAVVGIGAGRPVVALGGSDQKAENRSVTFTVVDGR